MEFFKKVGGWLAALLLWLWAIIPRALDWVGRSTLPDDWEQLMDEKLPKFLLWLFSTPGWVPGVLATALTLWLMYVSWPKARSSTADTTVGSKILDHGATSGPITIDFSESVYHRISAIGGSIQVRFKFPAGDDVFEGTVEFINGGLSTTHWPKVTKWFPEIPTFSVNGIDLIRVQTVNRGRSIRAWHLTHELNSDE